MCIKFPFSHNSVLGESNGALISSENATWTQILEIYRTYKIHLLLNMPDFSLAYE